VQAEAGRGVVAIKESDADARRRRENLVAIEKEHALLISNQKNQKRNTMKQPAMRQIERDS
tara:strand:- start:240 stop:422 length:183 start_codon:yes stop_codon:yes gene_type:complete